MNPQDPRKTALDYVQKLLEGRLKRAKIPGNPARYFQLEAGELVRLPDASGAQLQVKTFRHWSDAQIKLDADSGEFLGYLVSAFADPPAGVEMTQEQALELAGSLLQIPPDAVLESFQHIEWTQFRRLVQLQWKHVVQGLRVDGDYLRVVLNPTTKKIVEMERFWRTPKLR
jgi:hypothetical protein